MCLCVFSSASPHLTWRDVQHIIVKTSRAGHLSAPDWKTNAAGYNGTQIHTTHTRLKLYDVLDISLVLFIHCYKSVHPLCVSPKNKQTKLLIGLKRLYDKVSQNISIDR